MASMHHVTWCDRGELALPAPRSAHASVAIGSNVYALGGLREGWSVFDKTLTRDVLVLDTASSPAVATAGISKSPWVKSAELTVQRSFHSAVVHANAIYVLGGRDGSILNSVERLDLREGVWQRLDSATLTYPRASFGCGVVRDSIYVAGGETLSGSMASVAVLDVRALRWRDAPALSSSRRGLACAAVGDRYLYAVGGTDTRLGHGDTAVVEMLDVEREHERWQRRHELTTPRAFHSCVNLLDRSLVCSGGIAGDQLLSCVETYDIARDRWSIKLAAMAQPRGMHTSVVVDGAVLVVGGRVPSVSRRLALTPSLGMLVHHEQQWRPREHTRWPRRFRELVWSIMLVYGTTTRALSELLDSGHSIEHEASSWLLCVPLEVLCMIFVHLASAMVVDFARGTRMPLAAT